MKHSKEKRGENQRQNHAASNGSCLLAMKSMTYAEKAKRAAASLGISVEIVNIDPSITRRGCAFGLTLPCQSVPSLTALLDKQRVPYGDVLGDGCRDA